ncbi:MAG TPA: hypothetical protein VHA75_18505 [Rugosimonospora sp.]|nr:hypothetical protein [Rugosimonospora sp.]
MIDGLDAVDLLTVTGRRMTGRGVAGGGRVRGRLGVVTELALVTRVAGLAVLH